MSQPGFFDLDERHAKLSSSGDPLERLAQTVPWESFRAALSQIYERAGKSKAGRPPWDVVLMFKVLVMQGLYNLSDEQAEFQIRDRLSFMRFLGLRLEDRVPDARTIWLFRERLKDAGLLAVLFEQFEQHLMAQGYQARKGQLLDAAIVPVPKQRQTPGEKASVKAGEVPAEWEAQPEKERQKDRDAQWTQKNGRSFYGYKNHINVDVGYKLIRRYFVTGAAIHDGGPVGQLLTTNNRAGVWADKAYRSHARTALLNRLRLRNRMHYAGHKHQPLTAHQEELNRARSKIRARVEHVFGYQQNSMGGRFIRTIGLARAAVKIGLANLIYNLARFVYLERRRMAE